jgi:hypothetical protein
LAVQGDGSVDILSRPDDPAVVDEIRHWSRRQSPSPGTGVTAAIIHLEPIPEAPAALTPPRTLRAADTASRDVSPITPQASGPAVAPVTPREAAAAAASVPPPAPAAAVAVQSAPPSAPAHTPAAAEIPAEPAPAPAATPSP